MGGEGAGPLTDACDLAGANPLGVDDVFVCRGEKPSGPVVFDRMGLGGRPPGLSIVDAPMRVGAPDPEPPYIAPLFDWDRLAYGDADDDDGGKPAPGPGPPGR